MDLKTRSDADTEAVWASQARAFGVRHPGILGPDARIAKEAFVVTLACFVRAGRRRTIVSVNDLFDVLARRWSPRFQDAERESGARTIRDMLPATVEAARRDLLRAGIRFETLWRVATNRWAKRRTRNRLYSLKFFRCPGFAGYSVILKKDTPELAEFARRGAETIDLRGGWQLLSENEPTPRRTKRFIAGEQEYNIIEVGPRAERVRQLQERARLRFNVRAFLADYEAAEKTVHELETLVGARWPKKPNLLGYPHRVREITDKNSKTVRYPSSRDVETKKRIRVKRDRRAVRAMFPRYDAVRQLVNDYKKVADHVREMVVKDTALLDEGLVIKSAYDFQINRRYQWQHFWPSSVSAHLTTATEEFPATTERELLAEDGTRLATVPPYPAFQHRVESSPRGRWFDFPEGHVMLGLDISSSQTQLIAVLIGCRELEEEAARGSFKKHLATRAWDRHRDPKDSFKLNLGTEYIPAYTGADDRRLEELVKDLWLRVLYGGALSLAVRDHRIERKTYGPGWGEGEDDGETSAWSRANKNATNFLRDIRWYANVKKFLDACRYIGEHADPYEGVVFIEPLDQVQVRWHEPERTTVYVDVGHMKLTVEAPVTKNGHPLVDLKQLRSMTAPCLTHMTDAYFSSLVIERLSAHGVANFVGLHDCWYVPTSYETLTEILNDAAIEWMQGLGPIYDRLAYYLDGTKFEADVREMRTKWAARIERQDWPTFRAAESSAYRVNLDDIHAALVGVPLNSAN